MQQWSKLFPENSASCIVTSETVTYRMHYKIIREWMIVTLEYAMIYTDYMKPCKRFIKKGYWNNNSNLCMVFIMIYHQTLVCKYIQLYLMQNMTSICASTRFSIMHNIGHQIIYGFTMSLLYLQSMVWLITYISFFIVDNMARAETCPNWGHLGWKAE